MGITDQQLFQLLLENEYLSQKDLDRAQQVATQRKISLYEALLQNDLISDENLGKLIADHLKLPLVVLAKVSIPLAVLHIIPQAQAESQQAVAFNLEDGVLKVGTAQPTNTEFLEMLARKAGASVKLYYATPRDIQENLKLYKKELEKAFSDLLKTEVSASKGSSEGEVSVAKIVDTLIEYAYEQKTSDIHVEPNEEQSLVRFRIDGVLHDVLTLPKSLHDRVITRIKVLSRLRTDEHLSAQDGKMKMTLPQEEVDVRVSIVPIVEGEKAVMRLLTSRFRQFGLTDLGMASADLAKVKNGFEKPYGMILSTGPTGSGKTTTMYAILKILNTRDKNIATIEDPVEYEIDGLNQVQVNPKTNLTFADGLRSLLRQDPDIVYVGEIRDEETANIAINSAMTGHLVLSTLHTNDAATSLPRLIDMSIEPFLVASTVNVIVAQRLVRKICEKCKVSVIITFDDLVKHISAEEVKKHFGDAQEIRTYHGKGCDVCHTTGYVGRVGIFEVLEVTQPIQELITAKADSEVIAKKAVEEGMTTMMSDGLDKVQQGVTTVEEILRATKE